MYSNVYDEQFPPYDGAKGLDLLRSEGFLENPRVFLCPSSNTKPAAPGQPLTEATVDYEYFGGHCESDSVDTVLVRDKPDNHDKFGNILFLDGHVKGYPGSNWQNNASGQGGCQTFPTVSE
jgi:prepilin-type processing-associated H-X9-DG protein